MIDHATRRNAGKVTDRTQAILRLLHDLVTSDRGWTMDALAERHGCTRRTIYRYVGQIERAGWPVEREHDERDSNRAYVRVRLPGALPGTSSGPLRHGTPWTTEQDDVLLRLYGKVRTRDLARRLGRSHSSVKDRAARLGLQLSAPKHRWSPEEDEVLSALYGSVPTTDIAARLGRRRKSVYDRAYQLGLGKQRHEAWTESDERALRTLYTSMPVAELARRLGRTEYAVRMRAAKLGLRRRPACEDLGREPI